MKVHKIRLQNSYAEITIENENKIRISLDDFYELKISLEEILTEDKLLLIKESGELFAVMQIALRLLTKRSYSKRELFNKILLKGGDKKYIEVVLTKLINKGFIDDELYAKNLIETQLKYKKNGLNRIKSVLFSKGIAKEIIDNLIPNYKEEESLKDNIKIIAQKKYNSLVKRKIEPKKIKEKLTLFLFNKGYELELIKSTIKEIITIKNN